MFCSNCGASISSGEFCPQCGKKVVPDEKRSRKWYWSLLSKLIIVTVIIGSILGYTYYNYQSSLEHTVEDHFAAIRDKKITEAYYSYTSTELQKILTLDSFKDLVKKTPALSQNIDIQIDKSSIDYPFGTVKFTLISIDHEETPGEYKLYRDGGKWKIYNIELVLPQNTPDQDFSHATHSSLIQHHTKEIAQAELQTLSKTSTPDSDSIISTVSQQLDALEINHLENAYENFSSDYKKSFSLDDFKKFAENYPILTKFKTATFKDVSISGGEGLLTVVLDPKAGSIPIEYKLIQENNVWRISSMQVILPHQVHEDPKQIVTIIQTFIKFLQAGENTKAYSDYTSKKFQEITPFSNFQEFTTHFPVMNDFQNIDYSEPKIEKGAGTVTVQLRNKQQMIELLFTLGVEENSWKIWGIKMVHAGPISNDKPISSPPEKITEPVKNEKKEDLLDAKNALAPQIHTIHRGDDIGKRQFDTDELNKVIQGQLKEIQEDKIEKAYKDYFAKEFTDTTTQDEFADFIQKYPVFKNYKSLMMNNLIFNNNIPTFSGNIVGKDDKIYHLEYDFMKENGAWKIIHIEISLQDTADRSKRKGLSEGKSNGPLEFVKAFIGNTVDTTGVVQDSKTVFKSESGDIFVNLYIQNGIKGTRIDMIFKHLDSGSNIPPIATTLQEDGSAVISYDFTPPAKGWPRGTYSLVVSSSTGQNKEFNIRIE